LTPRPRLRATLAGALIEIAVLRGEPEILVLGIRERSFETDDRLFRRLDQRPRLRARGLVGRLRLLRFVVHILALHEQSACRSKCAVLAGFWLVAKYGTGEQLI